MICGERIRVTNRPGSIIWRISDLQKNNERNNENKFMAPCVQGRDLKQIFIFQSLCKNSIIGLIVYPTLCFFLKGKFLLLLT